MLHFDRECQLVDPQRLYGPEYGAVALTARGYACLAMEQPRLALTAFRGAQRFVDGYLRAVAGEAVTLDRLGRREEAARAWRRAESACDAFLAAGHRPGALIAGACVEALRGDTAGAVSRLEALLAEVPASHFGWYLPLEPALAGLRSEPGFQAVLVRLADRAR